MKPSECNGRHGVTGGHWRILERLAFGSENPKLLLRRLRIEKSTRIGVVEALDHLIRNFLRGSEVSDIRGHFIRVQACDGSISVVVEEPRAVASRSLPVGISTHVPQSAFLFPRRCDDAVERPQREMSSLLKVKCVRSFKISGNAQCVPAYIDSLIHERGWSLQTRSVHLLLCRFQKLLNPFLRKLRSRDYLVDESALVKHILCRIMMHLANFVDVIMQACDLRLFS